MSELSFELMISHDPMAATTLRSVVNGRVREATYDDAQQALSAAAMICYGWADSLAVPISWSVQREAEG